MAATYIIKGKRWFFVSYVLEICSLEVNLLTCKQCQCTYRLLLAWVFTRKYNLKLNLSMNSSEDSRSLFLESKSRLVIPRVLWSSSWFRHYRIYIIYTIRGKVEVDVRHVLDIGYVYCIHMSLRARRVYWEGGLKDYKLQNIHQEKWFWEGNPLVT
jgi:hypothetical protein